MPYTRCVLVEPPREDLFCVRRRCPHLDTVTVKDMETAVLLVEAELKSKKAKVIKK